MKSENKPLLFLVDDDALYVKALEVEFLQHTDFVVETFATAELCIARLSEKPNLIILDYHLDGIDKNAMNGLSALKKIKSINQDIPVVMLSSQRCHLSSGESSPNRLWFQICKRSSTVF